MGDFEDASVWQAIADAVWADDSSALVSALMDLQDCSGGIHLLVPLVGINGHDTLLQGKRPAVEPPVISVEIIFDYNRS